MRSPNRPPVGTNPRGKPIGGNGAARKIPKKVDRKIGVCLRIDNLINIKIIALS